MRTGPPPGAAFGLPFAGAPPSPLPFSPPLPLGAPLGAPLAAGAPSAAAAAGFSPFGAFAGFSSLAGFSPFGFLSVSAIDLGSRTFGDPDLRAVVPDLEADAGRLAVLGIGDRDVGQVDRQLLGDDAALLLCCLALVALDH